MPRPAGSMLAESVKQLCSQAGVECLWVHRGPVKTEAVATLRDAKGAYWTLRANVAWQVQERHGMTPDELDDALYDAFVVDLQCWKDRVRT